MITQAVQMITRPNKVTTVHTIVTPDTAKITSCELTAEFSMKNAHACIQLQTARYI